MLSILCTNITFSTKLHNNKILCIFYAYRSLNTKIVCMYYNLLIELSSNTLNITRYILGNTNTATVIWTQMIDLNFSAVAHPICRQTADVVKQTLFAMCYVQVFNMTITEIKFQIILPICKKKQQPFQKILLKESKIQCSI